MNRRDPAQPSRSTAVHAPVNERAVTGVPSWKVSPSRTRTVQTRRSSLVTDSAAAFTDAPVSWS
nr:hypothetical protein [Actinomadura madurae]